MKGPIRDLGLPGATDGDAGMEVDSDVEHAFGVGITRISGGACGNEA